MIEQLAPGSPGAFDLDRIEGTFRSALRENGFRPEAYDGYLADLRRLLRPDRALTAADLEGRGLGEMVSRYHRVIDGEHVTATYVFPGPRPQASRTSVWKCAGCSAATRSSPWCWG